MNGVESFESLVKMGDFGKELQRIATTKIAHVEPMPSAYLTHHVTPKC